MTNNNRMIRVYILILAILALIASGLRIGALLEDYDTSAGHFDGKALITAASALISVLCIAMITYLFFADRSKKLIATFSTPMTYVPTGAVCAALVFFLLEIRKKLPPLKLIGKGTSVTEYLLLTVFVLGIFAIAHFILTAAKATRTSSSRAALGLATVLAFALYTSYLYFDKALTINNPNKIIDEMAFLLAALFFLYEIRISISREAWHLYVVIGAIASAICFYSALPAIVMFGVNEQLVSKSLEENVLMLTVAIFIYARLILVSSYKEDKKSDFISTLKDAALDREQIICELEETARLAQLEEACDEEPIFNEELIDCESTTAPSNAQILQDVEEEPRFEPTPEEVITADPIIE